MNFTNKIPLLFIIRVPHLGNNISCIYLMKTSVDSQVLQKKVSKKKQFYDIFIVDDVMKEIHKAVQYYDSSLIIYPLPSDILNNQQKIITAIKKKQTIVNINLSFLNLTNNSFCVLCNILFNPDSMLKYIAQLNLSGNKLTASCLHTLMESLQHCVIQQLIMFHNHIQNLEVIDIITGYRSNCNVSNFKLGIPLMVINNSSIFKTGYTGTLFLKNICKADHILDLITTYSQGYDITDYIIFFTQSNIMVDDLRVSLSILRNDLPCNTKVVFCETDISDEIVEKIAMILTKSFTQGIGFILSSRTKLLVHSFFCENIATDVSTFSSINTLQITNCKLEPDQLKVMLGVCCKCKHINLSGCQIGDEGLKWFSDLISTSSEIPHINTLNISVNRLTSSSISTIVKLLSYCIIEHLVISGNKIDDEGFNQALCMQYWTSKNVVYTIPLMVRGTVFDKDITVCNTYITALETTNTVSSVVIDDSAEHYYIYHLSRRKRTVLSFKNKNMRGLIGELFPTLLPWLVNNIKFKFEKKFQKNIDLTQCDFDSNAFSMICMMIFNEHSLLRYVNEIILSSNQLQTECMSKFLDSLQYCCFDCITIYEYNPIKSFADLLFKRCCTMKKILNTVLRKPLTLISYRKIRMGGFAKYAITYFVSYKETKNLLEIMDLLLHQCDALVTHKFVLLNFLSKNQNLIDLNCLQLLLQRSAMVELMIYEVGITYNTALAIIDAMQTIWEMVEYVISPMQYL